MCNCTTCVYTDSFSQKGFDAWPKGAPKGPRKANAEYVAHVSFGKRGTGTAVAFKPGAAPVYVGVSWFVAPAPIAAKYRPYLQAGYRVTTSQTEATL